MEKVAFISGGVFIYWSSIILTLAVVTAITLFIAVYMGKSKNAMGAFAAIPIAALLSMVLGRLIHWYCRADAYESLEAAMSNFSSGGYALMGAFIGCILTACLLRLVRIVKNLPQMLDAMAIAGGTGIAVGRLASLFNSSDRGVVVAEHLGLPIAYPVTNAVSGVVENRLATFMLQSVFTGGLVLLLLLYMFWRWARKKPLPDGDIALLFLSAYCGSQVLFDSTRYDSLFMRSNGFISIVQILSVVVLFLVLVLFSIRMVSRRGLKFHHFVLWILFAGGLGAACYMEYHVQRHGDQAMFAYTIMAAGIALMLLVTLIVRGLGFLKPTAKKEKKPRKVKAPVAAVPEEPEEEIPVPVIPAAPVPVEAEPEVPEAEEYVMPAPAAEKEEDGWEEQWTEVSEKEADEDDAWLSNLSKLEKEWSLEEEEPEDVIPSPAEKPESNSDDDWENDWTEPVKAFEEDWVLQLDDLDFFKK